MTPEDLQQARMHLWHQDGAALLTTEDVKNWLDEVGFCSLLPGAHPLASLAQAIAGSDGQTPDGAAQHAARQLAAQLLAERAAAPLVWDESSMLTGEQFDAVASAEVLPYLYCLRGDRDLKKVPQGSPLVQAVWAELQEGPKTVAEIVTGVGQEITEAAVLRALRELWVKLRVIPVLEAHASDEGAVWDLLQRVFPAAVKQGSGMSQPLAVSAMVSVYLGGAVAATAEEVEDALGPLASRSRVREVLNALQATRQLAMLPIGRSSAYALAGGSAEVLGEIADKRDHDALKIAKLEAKVAAAGRSPREFGERKAWAKEKGVAARTRPRPDASTAGDKTHGDKAAEDRSSSDMRAGRSSAGGDRAWKPRSAGAGAGASVRKPYAKREGAGSGEKREWKPRAEGAGFAAKKPFVKREGEGYPARKPFVKRASSEAGTGERKEWMPRAAGAGAGFGARKPFVKREGGDRPARPYGDRPARSTEAGGERKEWKPRAAGAGFPARKPFVKRDGPGAGEKPEWKPRAPGSAGAGFGPRKPFVKREGGERPDRADRSSRPSRPSRPAASGAERREWKDRPAAGGFGAKPGERKPFTKRAPGDYPPRPSGKSFGGPKKFGAKPFGAKPSGSKPGGKTFARKPFGAGPGASRTGASRPGASRTGAPRADAPAKRVYKRKDEDA